MSRQDEPAANAASIAPSDTAQLTDPCRAVFIGGAGNLVVVMAGGQEVTFNGLAAGDVLPIKPRIIKSTGTTATNILALW